MDTSMGFTVENERPFDLICMGRIAIDLYSEQINTSLENTQTLRKYVGGCAGNIAIGSARQGLKTAMLSCVGEDEMGRYIQKTLEKEGVDTHLLYQSNQHLTALVLLGVSPPDHFPLIFYRENCADMQLKPQHCDGDMIKSAKALLITGTGLSLVSMKETTHYAVDFARYNRTKVIIDLDYRPVLWQLTTVGDGESRYKACSHVSAQYAEILPKCDLIVGTEEEICIAGNSESLDVALSNIHQISHAPIVLKRGEAGCEVHHPNQEEIIKSPAFKVDVLNVLGAGDAFMSGLLGRLLKGYSWQDACQYANACGALVVTRHGCSPAIPNIEELEYFIHHYEHTTVAQLLDSEILEKLHHATKIKSNLRHTQLVLQLDKNQKLIDSCRRNKRPISMVNAFNRAVLEGFTSNYSPKDTLQYGINVDPRHAFSLLGDLPAGINISVAINRDTQRPIEWIDGLSAYSSMLPLSPTWNIVVTLKYHPQMELKFRHAQLEKLKELSIVCRKLERQWCLKLKIPKQYGHDSNSIAGSMEAIYNKHIYPHSWMLPTQEESRPWGQIAHTIRSNDGGSSLLVGFHANASFDEHRAKFEKIYNKPHIRGLTIGEDLLDPCWEKYLHEMMTLEDISDLVAEHTRLSASYCHKEAQHEI